MTLQIGECGRTFTCQTTQATVKVTDSNRIERVAFVGMSGGGKSTLVSLIPRFYDVTDGSIKIDGVDVRDFKLRALRDQIGMVMQDSVLFSESVAMNIRMGNPEASDEDVIAAAKAANAHEFISNLPNGYDTPVGDDEVFRLLDIVDDARDNLSRLIIRVVAER